MTYKTGDVLLGKYQIDALIGPGLPGEAFRVTRLDLNQTRAIKLLRRDLSGVTTNQFVDAGQHYQLDFTLSKKLHQPEPNPHLLQVFDVYQDEDQVILEMDFAAGSSLAKRIRQANARGVPILVGDAARIIEDVAIGLAALHRVGIVHRNIKPANILLDENGRARLADLGSAQLAGASMRSQLQNPLPHPGTPEYMSPEQKDPHQDMTPAADIFSLGVVLFELLTGSLYTAQPAGTRASSTRRDIPAGLENLLMSMLAKAPGGRPANGEETARLLSAASIAQIARAPVSAPDVVVAEPKADSGGSPQPVTQPSAPTAAPDAESAVTVPALQVNEEEPARQIYEAVAEEQSPTPSEDRPQDIPVEAALQGVEIADGPEEQPEAVSDANLQVVDEVAQAIAEEQARLKASAAAQVLEQARLEAEAAVQAEEQARLAAEAAANVRPEDQPEMAAGSDLLVVDEVAQAIAEEQTRLKASAAAEPSSEAEEQARASAEADAQTAARAIAEEQARLAAEAEEQARRAAEPDSETVLNPAAQAAEQARFVAQDRTQVAPVESVIQPEPEQVRVGDIPANLPVQFTPRYFNINFTRQHGLMLGWNELLNPGEYYVLLVDVGAAWERKLSLFRGKTAFPDQAARALLSAEDLQNGWMELDAVFTSQDFEPGQATERIRIPLNTASGGIPYREGRLTLEPGPLRLYISPRSSPRPLARGRLVLKYGSQVLASILIEVGVLPAGQTARTDGPANNIAAME